MALKKVKAPSAARIERDRQRELSRTQKLEQRKIQFDKKLANRASLFQAKVERNDARVQARISRMRPKSVPVNTTGETLTPQTGGGLVSFPSVPFSIPANVTNESLDYRATQSPAVQAPTVSSSGYNPAVADAAASAAEPVDESGTNPVTSQSSDDIMRNKLLVVKNTNPEYYSFIAEAIRANPELGINSTTGMGDVPTTAPSTSWSETFKQVLTPAIQTWGSYLNEKVKAKTLTPEQAQAKLESARQSNAYLTGDNSANKMYIFGALSFLAIAWFLVRRNNKR